MSPVAQIALVAGLTLLASFFCSLFEAALYAITASQIELLRRQGGFGTERLSLLRQNIDEPITAILTINTVANTIGSAWSGALVGMYYGPYFGLFAAGLTLAILMFAEIVPKSLGVAYAFQLGRWIAWPLQVMVWVIWPLVKISGRIVGLLTSDRPASGPTEDEVIVTSRLAYRRGELRLQELRWVENALRLDRVKARDMMTPRTVVYSLPADMSLSGIQQHSKHWVHSRLPLTEDENPDQIVGVIYRRDVFDAIARGQRDRKLRELMRTIDFVPETMRGHDLLDKFIKERKHMVCVVNEYGGFEGVVTLEDVLEALLGTQIVDEFDLHPDMQQFARQRAQQLERLREEPANQQDDEPKASPDVTANTK